MRIAFLSFYSGHIDRGVETATAALGSYLSQKHSVTLFQAGERIIFEVPTVRLSTNIKWVEDTSHHFSRFFYLDYYSRKILQFTFTFLPHFFRGNFDIVISTDGGWQVPIIRILTWLTGKKLLVQGNAGIGRDDLWQLLWWPNYFIAISPAGYTWAKQFFPWVKKSYIPYGVNIRLFEKTKPAQIALKKPIVLCVAAFLPYKQIDLLIKAMKKVPQASLLVIGQGVLEKKLRALGKTLLGKRFLLKTGITHSQLIGFYKGVQLFSLPSKSSEAFGIVYVEALAAGLPIVAPDDHNRREIIGAAGIFVDPTHGDQYAQAIAQALTLNIKQQAKMQAEKFSWDKIGKKYEEILTSL